MYPSMRTVLFICLPLLLSAPSANSLIAADESTALKHLAMARLEAARRAYKESITLYQEGRTRDVDRTYRWSKRLLEAEREVNPDKAAQLAAFEGHWQRMKQMEDLVRGSFKAGASAAIELPAAQYYRLDAELAWAKAKGQ